MCQRERYIGFPFGTLEVLDLVPYVSNGNIHRLPFWNSKRGKDAYFIIYDKKFFSYMIKNFQSYVYFKIY